MATKRETPYVPTGRSTSWSRSATWRGGGPIVGGFSDVSGLGNEINYSEYRNGND